MKIHIKTEPETVDSRAAKAVDVHPDVSLRGNTIYLKGNPIACYQTVDDSVEVRILEKPWYISRSLIEFRLRELFA